MKVQHRERGQMLIMTAIELSLLIGFLALAADVGVLFHSKRHMQAAADAAATAGALQAMNDPANTDTSLNSAQRQATVAADAIAAAQSAAASNGYTNGQDGVVVTINTPPTSGYHESTGYVEAIISKPDPLYFMKFFSGKSTATVAARAVAGDPSPATGCIYLTAPTGTGLYLQGSALINAPNCGIYVNSTSSSAVYDLNSGGSNGSVDAAFLDTAGGIGKFQTTPTPTTPQSAPGSDPFGNYEGPQPGADNSGCNKVLDAASYSGASSTSPLTIDAGGGVVCFTNFASGYDNTNVYNLNCGTSGQSHSPPTGVTLTNVTLTNGYFVFEDGVTLGGTVNIGYEPGSSYGATADNYGGCFNQNNANLSIVAPTNMINGYNSIGLMQPSTNQSSPLQLQFGSSTETLDSYIYAPSADLYLQDSGGNVVAAGIVAAELYDQASTITIPSYNVVHSGTTPLRDVSLVE